MTLGHGKLLVQTCISSKIRERFDLGSFFVLLATWFFTVMITSSSEPEEVHLKQPKKKTLNEWLQLPAGEYNRLLKTTGHVD